MPGSDAGVAGRKSAGWDDYSASWAALHGGVDPRRSSTAVRLWLRLAYVVARALVALRIRPSTVTVAGVMVSALVPVAGVLRGAGLFVAAGLVVLAAVADSSDGAVAVLSHRATRLGAFQDSVADRLSEAAWLVGLWLVGGPGFLVAACGAVSWLHEYMRARAAVAGMAGIGAVTVGERPTRAIAATAAFVLGGLAWLINPRLTPGAVTIVLAVWLVLGILGGLRLNGAVRAALRGR